MTTPTLIDAMQHAETYRQLIMDNCALFKQVSRDCIMVITEKLESGQIIACAMLRANPPGRIVCSNPSDDPGSALRSLHDKTMRTVHGYRNMGKTVSHCAESVRARPPLEPTRSTYCQQYRQRHVRDEAEDLDGCSETSEDSIKDISDSDDQSDEEEDDDDDDESAVFTPVSSLPDSDPKYNHEEPLRAAISGVHDRNPLASLIATGSQTNDLRAKKQSYQSQTDFTTALAQPSHRQIPDVSHGRGVMCDADVQQQYAGGGLPLPRAQPKSHQFFKDPQLNLPHPTQGAPIRQQEVVSGNQGSVRPGIVVTPSSQPFLALTDLKATQLIEATDILITINWKLRNQHRILERCHPSMKAIQEAVLRFCGRHSSAFGQQRTAIVPHKQQQHRSLAGGQGQEADTAPRPGLMVHIGPSHSRLPWNNGLLRASLRSVSPSGNGGDTYDLANYKGDDLGKLLRIPLRADSIPCVSVDVDFVRVGASSVPQSAPVPFSAPIRYPISD